MIDKWGEVNPRWGGVGRSFWNLVIKIQGMSECGTESPGKLVLCIKTTANKTVWKLYQFNPPTNYLQCPPTEGIAWTRGFTLQNKQEETEGLPFDFVSNSFSKSNWNHSPYPIAIYFKGSQVLMSVQHSVGILMMERLPMRDMQLEKNDLQDCVRCCFSLNI